MKSVLKLYCADAKLHSMKIIIALMVFALAFGGYSAASHAMGAKSCSSSKEIQKDACPPHVQNSPDHAQKHDKSGKGFCLDCAHSCAASILMPITTAWQPTRVSSNLNSVLTQFQPENRLFSLLRPPRTLT